MTHSFSHDERPRHGPTERTLEMLWVDFIKLQRLRNEIMLDFDVTNTGNISWELTDQILAPIASELRQLASRAAKVGSTCHDDIEYKAVMLAEYIPLEDRAIQAVLARSLVSDIKSGVHHSSA